MASTTVTIDARKILGWDSFHDEFARVMGFPEFYGRNMDAWIDCMTSIDEPGGGMTTVHAPRGGLLAIHVEHAAELKDIRELWDALVECTAFVNYRRIEAGDEPVLALSFEV